MYVIIVMRRIRIKVSISGKITITGGSENATDIDKQTDEREKEVIFKSLVPFIDCTSKINNTQIDHDKYLDIVMTLYNLIEYSYNDSKTSGSLWQYYKDESALTDAETIENIPGNSALFKSKVKIKKALLLR